MVRLISTPETITAEIWGEFALCVMAACRPVRLHDLPETPSCNTVASTWLIRMAIRPMFHWQTFGNNIGVLVTWRHDWELRHSKIAAIEIMKT
jgi:hypothetical protein